MRSLALVLAGVGQVAAADAMFENLSDRLPHHVYDGSWEHFVGGGVAVFDCNDDGLPEIFAAGGETPAHLMINAGDFRFHPAELEEIKGVTGAYPIDIDGDAILDLFVLRAGRNVALKGGADCQFEDASAAFGLPEDEKWSTAFTAWWTPGQARPTMAIGNYVDRTNPDGPFEACDSNTILTPMVGGYAATALEPGFCPLSILAARDARGRQTLRISNDRHYYVKGGFEQMWDIADRRFLGEADGWKQVSLWGMGIASRDLDGDGRDEVMLTSMGDQVLQLAQPDGTYRAAPYDIGTYAQRPHTGGDGRPSTGWHAEFGDIDNDGLADLFLAKGNVDQMPGLATRDPNNLLMQQSGGQFVEVAGKTGLATMERSRGAALADFDGDGRLDIVVVNRRAPMELHRNVTPHSGNWLRVSLRLDTGNRFAIGARVTVRTGTRDQVLQNLIGGGHAGGQALPLHIGLGQAEEAAVTVEWPDGVVTEHQLTANRNHIITRP